VDLAYHQGERNIEILNGASGDVYAGETVGLLGPSGAGKSSLLHLLGLLDRPNAGSIVFDGDDCITLSDRERTLIRRTKLGFVYQFHHLLHEFSALENVILPQLILGRSQKNAEKHAMELLTKHNSIADTVSRARHYGEIAKDALAPLPDSDMKQALLDVVEFCICRVG